MKQVTITITVEDGIPVHEAITRVANVIHWACDGDLENEPCYPCDNETSKPIGMTFPSGVAVDVKTPTNFHVHREW